MSRMRTDISGLPALAAPRRVSLAARAADYVELTKPRIAALELVTVVVGAGVAAPHRLTPWLLAHLVVGTALLAASAGALNQWLERKSDARMRRTRQRPLPAGRLAGSEAVAFGVITFALGAAELLYFVRPLTAALGIACWLIYLAAYTPLKTRSPLNTAVGAASGAVPILMGWTATGTPLDVRALALAGVLFLWQFPHFMAIAWLYREDYARAGQKMLTVVDPSGLRAGAQSVVASLLLIPVSLLPAVFPSAGSPGIYGLWAFVLGGGLLAAAAMFMIRRDDRSARCLLRTSLLYLPCWMGVLLMVTL